MADSVLTIGNFDGVHKGHQALLARCRELAMERDAAPVAITFEPPPVALLQPDRQPPRILSPAAKRARLLRHVDGLVTLEPTPEMLAQTPEQFIEWLVRDHHPTAIVEGPDFHFGKGRAGTLDVLRTLGGRHGFQVFTQPRVDVALSDQLLAPVTSSLVRWLVGRGRVVDAAICLGQTFTLTAAVVRGEQQARLLGVPTANLDPAGYAGFIIPADGVYAGFATLADRSCFPAAISVGTKPTFGVRQLTIEAHLLDFAPEPFEALYGTMITIGFSRWLRDQWAFPDLATLETHLARDLAETRRLHEAGRLIPTASPAASHPIQPITHP